jgi:allophanate hydrolase subunit 2
VSLAVVRALGLVTIQDLGRPGRMHEAVPPGGALVPELLIAANRAAGNPDGAAAIEICGRIVVRAARRVEVATDRARHTLVAGEELAIASEPRRAAYLAVRGGIAAPLVLGGRGTLLCAGLGGLIRAGDTIAVDRDGGAAPLPATAHDPAAIDRDAPICVVPGPDLDAFEPGALDALCAAAYRISPASDRTGTRLVGASLPRRPGYVEVSRPMVKGALEVPRDGAPIVLGPEHPTTGGYPVIAVVHPDDLPVAGPARPGAGVRFRRA